MSPEIILHHLNASRSERIFWLLEELSLPYNVQVHIRGPSRTAPPSLLKISPTGKAPALILDGHTLTESAFIIHKLLRLPDIQTKKDQLDVQVDSTDDDVFWSHYAEGSMMNLFQASAIVGATSNAWVNGMVVGQLEEGDKKAVQGYSGFLTTKYLGPQMQNTIDFAESAINKTQHGWFSGTDKPGSGDFMMFFAINSLLAGTRAGAFNVGDGLKGWYKRVLERPAAQRALQRIKEEEEKAKSKM
ncbi:glutathione transferase [Kwoniella mangroviensis CBS 8886]|nr:glutathione transferase [Kwoniella mangroviensis CBS 8886]